MSLYWLLAAIVIITFGVYYGVSIYTSTGTAPNRIGNEQMSLSKVTSLGSNVDLNSGWTNSSGSTLIFFILPTIKDRTSVVGNEYATALNIGSKQAFKILIAPDAGRSQMLAPAMLEVYVNGSSDPEQIDIASVHLQRWNCVMIVKQGRKFNIYVNGQLSVSHTCTAMPAYDDTQPMRIGDPRLGGSIALISLAPYAMQMNDVQNYIREASDTDNKPYLSSEIPSLPSIVGMKDFILTSLNDFIICPGGNCSSIKPTGPMYEWTSNYA